MYCIHETTGMQVYKRVGFLLRLLSADFFSIFVSHLLDILTHTQRKQFSVLLNITAWIFPKGCRSSGYGKMCVQMYRNRQDGTGLFVKLIRPLFYFLAQPHSVYKFLYVQLTQPIEGEHARWLERRTTSGVMWSFQWWIRGCW